MWIVSHYQDIPRVSVMKHPSFQINLRGGKLLNYTPRLFCLHKRENLNISIRGITVFFTYFAVDTSNLRILFLCLQEARSIETE